MLKDFFRDLVDIVVLLSVTYSRLVKFCTPCLVNNVVVASLKDLKKDHHLLIFHQVEGAFFEVERIMN